MEASCEVCVVRHRDATRVRHHLPETFRWGHGDGCSVVLFFDYQGAEGLVPGAHGHIDYEDYMERDYGPNAGIWRVLRVLRSTDVRATFAITGAIARDFPDTVEAIAADGHEIAGHGFHHEVANRLSREEESEMIGATAALLRSLTGAPVRGWRNCHQSWNTPDLLVEHGLDWNSNSFMFDRPHVLGLEAGNLVEIPRHPHGDTRSYRRAVDPLDLLSIETLAFDTLYEESRATATFCPFTFHPYATGRPYGARALERLISHVRSHPGARFVTCDEVADDVTSQVTLDVPEMAVVL